MARSLEDRANLYANLSYFNERVIRQHNGSWPTSLLFWNHVDGIDSSVLKRLQSSIDGAFDESLQKIQEIELNKYSMPY